MSLRALAGLGAALALAASPAAAADPYRAEVAWTAYGIPHITAPDLAGAGYGQGYAYASLNLCYLADQVATANGERSKFFGADGSSEILITRVRNLDSDVFFKAALDIAALRASYARLSPDARDLIRGFVAGYNRYLRQTPPAARPAACRDAPWVRPLNLDDLLRLEGEFVIQAGLLNFLPGVIAAAPPGDPQASAGPDRLPGQAEQAALGSNGWALGREATKTGAGLVLANPHYPWRTLRFFETHLTVPGKLDVMGAAIGGLAGVEIGFNRDLAWTHTVATSRHYTLFELALEPGDPTAYRVDGRTLHMQARTVSVQVKGREAPETRTVYSTIYGPVVAMPRQGLAWSATTAYAVKDANAGRLDAYDAWLTMARARSTPELLAALRAHPGLPFVNTLAADRAGQALYADIDATPDLDAGKLAACAAPSGVGKALAGPRIYVLDGTRSACDWGLAPAAAQPSLVRSDYVSNSNDSYWLANPKAPQAGRSPVFGPVAGLQNLRTRMSLIEIGRRLDGSDGLGGRGFDLASAETVILANRNLGAALILDDVIRLCRDAGADLAPACEALAGWDRKGDLDARGAVLFGQLWRNLDNGFPPYETPFDASDPINTPRGLKRDAETAAKVVKALTDAVATLRAHGLAPDGTLAQAQAVVVNGARIPVHGGDNRAGVLNAQDSAWVDGVGLVPFSGSTFLMAVTFDRAGPVADAVMTYGQSADPGSAHAADQTRLYAAKRWVRLPFDRKAVLADAALRIERIAE